MFPDRKIESDSYNGKELLDKHDSGELNDTSFLRAFGKSTVYYSTPLGDYKDGTKRLFLLPAPDNTGYCPVFSSEERMREFYEKTGRVAYMILEGTFTSVLETTKKANDTGAPVKMGLIIDPGYYNVTVDAKILDSVIKITKC